MSNQSIFDSYVRNPNDYDEFLDSSGKIRPIWKELSKQLGEFNGEEFERRNNLLKRLITDNGITYNIYSKEENIRQWTMDLLPLVFSQNEWKDLEEKLTQRAEVIDDTLNDLYSEQQVVKEAILPPYLVYANPAFLRSCYGLKPKGGHFINLYAADIARSPDGSWWVLNDRIEAASGMGYVLENRMLSNRVLPEFSRDQSIVRLKPFYNQFVKAIQSLNPSSDPNARTALLTPGPANETYFEQSFLAKNLGLQLVEGADLTVRENKLFFKTLNGIQPINTMIRRLDSDWCDPLELRNESLLGVPGMLNCMRSENLGMVNSLGTGIMETVAMPAFLNNLSQHFRGEDLALPSVATWWCGQAKELEFVLKNLSKLVIKRTFRNRYDKAIFGPALDKASLEKLKNTIIASPEAYCAQELVSQATTPVYHNQSLHPHNFLIRVYLVRVNDQFKVLPGGLARIPPSPTTSSVSMQHGGMSKDVWIVKNRVEDQVPTVVGLGQPMVDLQVEGDDISSRAANNMFWLGRYVERIESLARHLRVIIFALTEDYHSETLDNLNSFIKILLSEEEFIAYSAIFDAKGKVKYLDDALRKYVWDEQNVSSLRAGFNNVRRIAFNAKDRLSTDTWQILGNMRGIATRKQSESPKLIHEDSIEALEETIDWLSAFSGKTTENMSQSLRWHFLMLGKRIERAQNIIKVVNSSVQLHPDPSENHLLLLLDYADSTITYRNRYLNNFTKKAVTNLLLKDQSNPRSLSFVVQRIVAHNTSLPWRSKDNQITNESAQQIALNLIEKMSQIQPELLYNQDPEVYFKPLQDTIDHFCYAIEQRFFAHT